MTGVAVLVTHYKLNILKLDIILTGSAVQFKLVPELVQLTGVIIVYKGPW